MKLRQKSASIIVLTLLGLTGAMFITSKLLLGSYEELEEMHVERHLERAINVIMNEIENLDAITYDWAAWDDTYSFIENPTQEYITSNLVDETFTVLRLNFIIYLHSSGRVVYSKGFDLESGEEMEIPLGLWEHLGRGSLLINHTSTTSSVKGILLLDESAVMVASRPIITSEDKGPIKGALIMGRFLDEEEIERLEKVTELKIDVQPLAAPQGRDVAISRTEQTITATGVLKDIYGKPALAISVGMPRDIYAHGIRSTVYFLTLLILSGAVFAGVTFLLIENQIISRLDRLSRDVEEIGKSGNLSARVREEGNDEITSLAREINCMLSALQGSQKNLRESEERYRRLVELSPVCIAVHREGRIIYINPAGTKLFGARSTGELIGKPILEMVHPDYREFVKRRIKKMEKGEIAPPFEEKFITLRGEVIDVEVVASKVFYGGKPAFLMVVRDITERKRVQERINKYVEELKRSNQLKDLFLDILRHDLLNPVGVIRNATELLLEEFPDKEELKVIKRSADKLIAIIENAAKLAKLESVQKLEKKKLDLREVIERATDEAKPMLREAEMVVENRVVQPITINANPVIGEVFTNLLTNAAKYAGEGKRVVIEAEERANQVKIMVKDYGPGVPDEDKERIFRRFERKEKGGIKGIGLGLAIVKRIVELHNGKVWVEDNPEGGSIFWVQLPKGRGE